MDKLDDLFQMQTALNNKTFFKHNIRNNIGAPLTSDFLQAQAGSGAALGPNSEVNQWLRHYLEADRAESEELENSLLWKWWSKDFIDLQNARVEIIDKLHFWICLAMTAGLTSAEVHRLYTLKNSVNLNRQDTDYSKANKTEADNKGVV